MALARSATGFRVFSQSPIIRSFDPWYVVTNILIVDDHKHVRDNLRAVFEQEPHWQVSEATNGKEALEIFRKVQPEVVVLDIVMDGTNGIGATYEIQRISPDTKIVIISGHYTLPDASVIARALGVSAFVQKADAVRVLIPTIKRLLAV